MGLNLHDYMYKQDALRTKSINTWSVHRGSSQGKKLMTQCITHSKPVTQVPGTEAVVMEQS